MSSDINVHKSCGPLSVSQSARRQIPTCTRVVGLSCLTKCTSSDVKVHKSCGPFPASQSARRQISTCNTIQYHFIAKCQYTDCTRNVLWCQVHSSHIHSNQFFKILITIANKHPGKKCARRQISVCTSVVTLSLSHKVSM